MPPRCEANPEQAQSGFAPDSLASRNAGRKSGFHFSWHCSNNLFPTKSGGEAATIAAPPHRVSA
jgi:hypothetical protein